MSTQEQLSPCVVALMKRERKEPLVGLCPSLYGEEEEEGKKEAGIGPRQSCTSGSNDERGGREDRKLKRLSKRPNIG
jgi:hypothetical protein